MTGSPSDDRTLDRLAEAEALKMRGNYTDALSILETLLIEDPDNVTALEEIAENELNLEHLDRAEKAARGAIRLDPKSYTAHYVVGFLCTKRELWDEALPSLKIANQLSPNNPEILRCLGFTLFHAGDQVKGIVTLERSLNLDPENELILCDLGVAYLHLRNAGKARTLFDHALTLDPQNVRAKECVRALAEFQAKLESVK